MSIFSDQMKAHLARYKIEHLGVPQNGLWRSNSRPYPHILPESDHRLNIIETIRDEFWEYFHAHSATLPLHTDFHHLNSSQAFAFNLFFPWASNKANHGRLLSALGLQEEEVLRWSFEEIPDPAERTTFDFYAELVSGRRVLIEVKLTEASFGTAIPDEAHRYKLQGTYVPRLSGKVTPAGLEESAFFLNYQLFRNVSHLDINRGDRLCLVLPRSNEVTWLQGERFLNYLEAPARDAIRMISVEDLAVALSAAAPEVSTKLSEHMNLFKTKYMIDGSGKLVAP